MTRRLVVTLVVGLLAATGIVLVAKSGSDQNTLTATFPRTTSLYDGAKVKVLGVEVGQVDSIEVKGTAVQVEISYDESVKLPDDVHALIVPPSIVGDRFVQLAPAYDEGPVLADAAELGLDRTGVPVELDETYSSLDELTAALGPEGANKDGALSRLVSSAAASLNGHGEEFNTTIRELAAAVSTLAGSSDDATGTVRNLAKVTKTLAGKDAEMRRLIATLARVGTQLNGQRTDITTAVRTLRVALRKVAAFTKKHRGELKRTISGLTSVSGTLARRTDELAGLVDLAPVGLTDLNNIYAPRNWDPSRPWLTPVTGRTGSQALRAPLFDDLDVQLGFTLGAVCKQLPPAQAAQLASFCDALQQAGGSLGRVITDATRSGVLNPTPGATSLGGLLKGDSR